VLGKHPAEQLINETAKLVPTSVVQLIEFGENGSFGSLRIHIFKEPQIAENVDLYYFKEPAWFQFFHFAIMHVLYKIEYVRTQNKQLYVMVFSLESLVMCCSY